LSLTLSIIDALDVKSWFLLTELVIEIEVSQVVELKIGVLTRTTMRVVLIARYRNELLITDNDDS
jgi:hypothetical protein